jgi:curved DNA-binding protein CbpA
MAVSDYYEVLSVSHDADADTIKKAYRKLAMQHHPDRNKGDDKAEQRFKDVNAAYDVLKDSQKKAAYDRFGHAAFEAGGMDATGGGAGASGFGDFTQGFTDIFEEMLATPPVVAAGRVADAVRRAAGQICAITWKWIWPPPLPARRHASVFPPASPATRATAAVPRAVRRPPPVPPVAGSGACGRSRDSSPSNAPARPAPAPAR